MGAPVLTQSVAIVVFAALSAVLTIYNFLRWWRRGREPYTAIGLPYQAAVFVRNPDARTSISRGDLVLTLPQQREGLALNPVAARCWELMDGASSLRAIADTVAREYEVRFQTALEEVRRLASRLRHGFYALEDSEWRLIHTHFNEVFAGAHEQGITELRREDGLIIHAASGALGRDGAVNSHRLRFPWVGARTRALKTFARHCEREAPKRQALQAFEEAWKDSAAGRLDEAELGFVKALELVPGWANPHYQLGYVYLKGGQFSRAVEQFAKTEEMSPGLFMVREYLALARRLADGKLSFDAFLLYERAAAAESGEPDLVIALCAKALELSADFPAAYLLLGRAYSRKRDYEKALVAYRNAISTDPDKATLCNALLGRGSIFMASGMAEQAVREFEKVIELDGSPLATRAAMAQLASGPAVH